jgi:hypothetical protein
MVNSVPPENVMQSGRTDSYSQDEEQRPEQSETPAIREDASNVHQQESTSKSKSVIVSSNDPTHLISDRYD